MTRQHEQTVDAVHTACRILEDLQELDGAGVTELSNRLDRAKSTIHSHLVTLEKNEYVVKDGGTYRLSLRYLEMGEYVKDHVENYEIFKQEINRIATETGEVAKFATEEHGRIVCLHKSKGSKGVETVSRMGNREDMHSTGLGKALLSQMAPDHVNDILNQHGLPQKTKNTLTDRKSLFKDLEQTRERGYAIDNQENALGIRCIAAPVVSDGNEIFGAVSITGPISRMSDERFDSELVEAITGTANVIEVNSLYS